MVAESFTSITAEHLIAAFTGATVVLMAFGIWYQRRALRFAEAPMVPPLGVSRHGIPGQPLKILVSVPRDSLYEIAEVRLRPATMALRALKYGEPGPDGSQSLDPVGKWASRFTATVDYTGWFEVASHAGGRVRLQVKLTSPSLPAVWRDLYVRLDNDS